MDIGNFRNAFKKLYGADPGVLEKQTKRYQQLDEEFLRHFDRHERYFFSTPGRTELSGNHTDHNNGRVLAASIDLDSIAVAGENRRHRVVLRSEGYKMQFEVDISDAEPKTREQGTTTALIRGIASRLSQLGYKTGGFDACMTSNIPSGSGLSSSASVEVLIATIFNHLFNNGNIPPQVIAQTGQYSENIYFGKPCGLMDQIACVTGGIVAIDFKNPQNPVIEKVNFNFEKQKYDIVIVDTGGSHAGLTEDYAAIPAEMKEVANVFGVDLLREVPMDSFFDKLSELREEVGDRAVLRGLHFLLENQRVSAQVLALKSGNFENFLQLVEDSGNSSFKWLQNIYSPKDIRGQAVTLALAVTEKYITEIEAGACRVHGGGFAGTIQVYIPSKHLNNYINKVEKIFGKGCAQVLSIREQGAVKLGK